MNDFKKTYQRIKRKKLRFLYSCFFDLFFVIAFFLAIWNVIFLQVFPLLETLSDLINVSPNPDAQLEEQAQLVQALAAQSEIYSAYSDLINWLIIFALIILGIIIAFNGFTYYSAAKLSSSKTKLVPYLLKFSAVSSFFYILVVLIFWGIVQLAVANAQMLVSLFPQTLRTFLLILFLVLVKYFWSISLVLITKHSLKETLIKSFQIGIKQFWTVFAVIFEVLIVLAAGFIFALILGQLHINLFHLGLLLFFIPAVSFARTLYFIGIDRIR